ncbi:MAG TPA: hypothetical protein VF691_03350, partial [Cytophagaceae bacterium]
FFFPRLTIFPEEKGLSFKEFVTTGYCGKKSGWSVLLLKRPRGAGRLHYFMGLFLGSGISFAGIITTLQWVLIRNSSLFLNKTIWLTIAYSLLVAGAVLPGFLILRLLYSSYKNGN